MEPKYVRLARELEKEAEDHAQDGWKLPPERELSAAKNVSRQTLRQALSLLEAEGLIEKRRGSGNFVSRKMPEAKKIAVITPGREEFSLSLISRDVQNACGDENCTIQFFSTENRVGREREILSRFLSRPVDGICVEGTLSALPNPNLDLYQRLEEGGTCLVFFNETYAGAERNVSVTMDNEAGGYQAVRCLAQQNHRRIGFFLRSDSRPGMERCRGILTSVRDYGLPFLDPCYLWYDSRQYEAFRKPGSKS